MPELRHDPLHDQWVVFSPERIHRPHAFAPPEAPSFLNNPFAPGNESATPEEVDSLRPERSSPNFPDWTMRVVPNRYPAFVSGVTTQEPTLAPFESRPAYGGHEVIIETSDPHQPFHETAPDQMLQLLLLWQRRVRHWNQIPGIQAVQLFKNAGRAAGASLPHPHSQLTALPLVPPRLERMISFLEKNSSDYFSELLQNEISTSQRIVMSNPDWVVYCPYASRFPYEMKIVPKHPWPDYSDLDGDALQSLALILKSVSRALSQTLNDPPFNLVLQTIPVQATPTQRQRFRTHLELFPRISGIAGFELSTGLWMNSILPESAALSLKSKLS